MDQPPLAGGEEGQLRKGSTSTGGWIQDQPLLEAEEKRINLHWLVGRRDNFGKDQPQLVGGYRKPPLFR